MLVLQRKLEEELVITVPPSDVETVAVIKLVEVGRNKAKLGIIAGIEVKVMRRELEGREAEYDGNR